ncbi:FadR/GntR family transcriptional regulator [Streptomyces sp. NPDC048254]|uniref:FadR/GntR family transcriptional regulator n=1 Tax=Streptomyces sp. NPDC048254 TaxID=3365525 RepID=UPI00371F7A5C
MTTVLPTGTGRKHTAAGLARLREVVAAEKAALNDPMARVEAQDAFHALVVELAGNQTLNLLSGMLRHIVDRANAAHLAGAVESELQKSQSRKAHRTHAKLVDLIAAGKADEAEKLWHRHITAADDAVNAAGAKTLLDLLD